MDEYMRLALELGEKGRLDAPPNPWVGCVIVKDGKIIGEGFHPECGKPHAETFAIDQAGPQAEGSDIYITLEPCSHFGKTPPCDEKVIRAKPKRVIIGIEDPDPKVSGRGIQHLKEAGIEVITGVLKEKIASSLTPYLHHRKTGLPYVIAKSAISLDGRVAAKDGSSQWISSPESRVDAHRIRAESQAILVGSGTALADSPLLTVRDSTLPKKQPLRVILDRSGRISPAENTLILADEPEAVLNKLGELGVLQLLIEGGPTVLTSFLPYIDLFYLYIAPKILGDQGIPLFKGLPIQSIQDCIQLKTKDVAQFGDTVRICYQRKEQQI